jgi:hypothetical protein
MASRLVIGLLGIVLGTYAAAAQVAVNDTPGKEGEWGFRPEEGVASAVNPPGFVWRPQEGAASYQVQVAKDQGFARVVFDANELKYDCYCPPKTLEEGTWFWRYRFTDKKGQVSQWSQVRDFTIGKDSVSFPMPTREDLLGRIPKGHPRLFVRPEQLPTLRELAKGELKGQYDAMVKECERLLRNPPPTAEPPKYPPGVSSKSEEWRVIWWGNREYTIKVLNAAATLGFTRLLSGNEEYGKLGKRLLMEAAQWDPKGSTNYRYNDEAGMPYVYYFSRAYTFLNDVLSEPDKVKCRAMMRIRGNEMLAHLAGKPHFWKPFESHSNRAWHKLGEAGIAFLDEIPEASEWTWFAMNVFYNTYPVWCDSDGGWHEGTSYWESYQHRFTWFADIMRVEMGIDAYKKPYFSRIGYYAMYTQPPGTIGGGFGDLCRTRPAMGNRSLMTTLATQSGNPYWQWYVEALGGAQPEGGYIGFVRGALPKVAAKAPDDLPTSRVFRGIGQAMLNTNLSRAADNVELLFKSSPFGTQSHGYDSNNSFMLYAFGQRLLTSTGERDIYGSDHHVNWMWETKSVNSITVNGKGQIKHSVAARGEIKGFYTSPAFDYVCGEAGGSYKPALKQFTRHVLLVKPELIVIYDQLEAAEASTFEWLLHSPVAMEAKSQGDIKVVSGPAACDVSILAPGDLAVSLTDKFSPPPRPRIKLTEWHLTAQSKPARQLEFVTLIRPHRSNSSAPAGAKLEKTPGGYSLSADLTDGRVAVQLRGVGQAPIRSGAAEYDLSAVRYDKAGKAIAQVLLGANSAATGGKDE